jgi:zinc/manganese transport system ATP-binding protein
VFDCVAMGLWRDIGIWRSVGKDGKRAVLGALATVGLTDFHHRSVGSLSGGQFQRVLFARLLLQDASVVLLDEPFRAVDTKTVQDLVELILRWHTEGRTIIAALHDLDQVRAYFPQTLVLARELVAWGESSVVLAPDILTKARQLCEAWDTDAEVCERGEHEAQRNIA